MKNKPSTASWMLITLVCIPVTVITSITTYGQTETYEKLKESEFYSTTSKWFSAWQLVSKDIFKIETVTSVDFIFFDDRYVYSTSNVTVKAGHSIKGPTLLHPGLSWKKALHHDSLMLPDKSIVPVGLMSFAAPIDDNNSKAFFVMPLLSYWKKSGVTSKELGLEKLITGVFIHEFSHSQQMQNFGKSMTAYEQESNFNVPFTDDIVQDIFQGDSMYLKLYNKEVGHIYSAIKNEKLDREILNDALALINQRQAMYFKDRFKNMARIDNFFLTMEGLGQYAMYLWIVHPKGGNIKKEIAIAGVRRKKNRWSQDEGFALFLVLDRLAKSRNWANELFGTSTKSIIQLIDEHLHGNPANHQ